MMSGHGGHPSQNTISSNIAAVFPNNAPQNPQPISLLHIPPELVTRILLYISPLDIISCKRTCRILYDLCSSSIFRYLIQMERSAVSDDMNPGLHYPERLLLLENREEAWAMLNFHRSVNIPIPYNPAGHWSFTDGALLLGTALDYHLPTVGHNYITLPSLSDARDQELDWKGYNLEREILEILEVDLAVHEHDLIAALTV